jgi:hypothetical protein
LAIDAEVDLGTAGDAYLLRARLTVSLPGLDSDSAQQLIDAAHQTCPYSKATRGNIEVAIVLASLLAPTRVGAGLALANDGTPRVVLRVKGEKSRATRFAHSRGQRSSRHRTPVATRSNRASAAVYGELAATRNPPTRVSKHRTSLTASLLEFQ